MNSDITAVLEKQLALKRALDKQNVMRMLVQLDLLAPLFCRHLHRTDNYPSLWSRALVHQLRCVNSRFEDLLEIVESAGDFNVDEFMLFGMRACLLAGIDLATDNSQSFWKAHLACEQCEQCSRGYRAMALSQAVLLECFPIELCLEIAHQSDECYDHFTAPMFASLDAFIPVGSSL